MQTTESHTATYYIPLTRQEVTRDWTRAYFPATGSWGPWSTKVDGTRWVLYTVGLTGGLPNALVWELAADGAKPQRFACSEDAALREATYRLDVQPIVDAEQARLAEERRTAARK